MSLPRIMGIDPGTLIAGFAVVEARIPAPMNPRDFKILEVGVLKIKKSLTSWDRIGMMHQSMYELIAEFKPKICVLENVYFGKNVRSALTLGQVRGAFISAACRCEANIAEIASTSVKKIISGNGHSGKEEIYLALQALLGFDKGKLPYDASDALAIALSFSLMAAWEAKWPNNAFNYVTEFIKISSKAEK